MSTSNHPLPTAPGQHSRPTQHRTKTSFSFRSTHSHKSSGSIPKVDLHETHLEKESHRLKDTSKADPSVAMTEMQPSEVAKEAKQLPSIRDIQHYDKLGNPISDPDRSNPTRSRWERPLDTIRAFEEAIDGNYSRKSTYMRKGPSTDDGTSQWNRRSSYYGGTQVTTDTRNTNHNSYYGGVGSGGRQSSRPDSYVENRPNGNPRPESYYNNGENVGPSNGYLPNRARYPRTASEPQFSNGQGVYPVPGNQHSFDTVMSASGSGSSPETVGYSTDPSSENSSLDRLAPMPPPHEPADNYGLDGFGKTPQFQPPGVALNQPYGMQRQGNGYLNEAPPAVPRKEVQTPRAPMKLTAGNGGPTRPSPAEKRKSWFGKRFSKNS